MVTTLIIFINYDYFRNLIVIIIIIKYFNNNNNNINYKLVMKILECYK